MKIIDLLNKIANGEEVPKKIKYENDIYVLTDNYCYYCDETNLILSDRIFAEYSRLNDEVEILEEKKIPERLYNYISCGWNGTCKDLKREELFGDLKQIGSKINEIIDYLKSKGE